MSFAMVDGRTVHLAATEGIIEVDDAEIAKALDAMSTTRRVLPER